MIKFRKLETASVLSIAAIFTGLALGIFVAPVQGAAPRYVHPVVEVNVISHETLVSEEGRTTLVVTARRPAPANP